METSRTRSASAARAGASGGAPSSRGRSRKPKGPAPKVDRRPGGSPRRRGPRRPRRRLGWLLAALLGLALTTAALGLWLWSQAEHEGEGFVQLRLSDTGRAEVGSQLQAAGLVDSAALFAAYSLLEPWRAAEAGVHWLPRGAAPAELWHLVARRGARPRRRVLLPEGLDLFQVADRLASAGICSAEEFTGLTLTVDGGGSAEGQLYPATYEFYLNTSPPVTLARLRDEAKRRWAKVFARLEPDLNELERTLGFSQRDVIVLASMVEKEASRTEELGLVARVFLNRLNDQNFRPRGMLQSDPTAGYGCRLEPKLASCDGFDGRILPRMLRDPGNRYNTYKHAGLPPGPISSPSVAAIESVLRAPPSDALFFVADGRGGHRFSRTLRGHELATEQLRRSRQKP